MWACLLLTARTLTDRKYTNKMYAKLWDNEFCVIFLLHCLKFCNKIFNTFVIKKIYYFENRSDASAQLPVPLSDILLPEYSPLFTWPALFLRTVIPEPSLRPSLSLISYFGDYIFLPFYAVKILLNCWVSTVLLILGFCLYFKPCPNFRHTEMKI